MRRRFTINDAGMLVDRDGLVLGQVTGITIDFPSSQTADEVLGVGGSGTSEVQERLLANDSPSPQEGGAGETTLTEQIEEVWRHYCIVMKPRNTDLPDAERKLIRDALKVATVDELKRAINGCAASPFHMGQNDRNKKYNRLSQIIKGRQGKETTRERIDYFIDVAGSASPVASGNTKVPIDLSGVPPTSRGTIHNNRSWAKEMIEAGDPDEFTERRGQAALAWLRENCGHEPIIVGGKVTGWKAAE